MADVFESTLAVNLGCKAGEQLAIVTDTAPFAAPTDELPDRVALARRLAAAATNLGLQPTIVTYPPSGRSGTEPPQSVFEAVYPGGFCHFAREEGLMEPLLDKTIAPADVDRLRQHLAGLGQRFQAVLVLSRFSITHTRFRKLLTEAGNCRGATMPGVEPFMFSGVMTADWPQVARRSRFVAGHLSAANTVEVHSAGDRVLRFEVGGRTGLADTGLLTEPGSFGNLPGGEAFIAPVEGTADGELSIGPRENPGQWWFRFESGRMVEIGGDLPIRERLEQTFGEFPDARNLAELGVGTNEKANHPTNILEAEKILGTVHLALGDNASFGGQVAVPFHQDFVVYGPTLKLDGPDGSVELLTRGHLQEAPE